eukprot:m.96789 g.96789  ORF g.96789 m.96789 type:complete len:105 (-) comp51330_c0_seq7:430-744(-)
MNFTFHLLQVLYMSPFLCLARAPVAKQPLVLVRTRNQLGVPTSRAFAISVERKFGDAEHSQVAGESDCDKMSSRRRAREISHEIPLPVAGQQPFQWIFRVPHEA